MTPPTAPPTTAPRRRSQQRILQSKLTVAGQERCAAIQANDLFARIWGRTDYRVRAPHRGQSKRVSSAACAFWIKFLRIRTSAIKVRRNQNHFATVVHYDIWGPDMLVDALYLREKAHYCVALARKCTDIGTALSLEALGIELMEKAAQLESDRSLIDSPSERKQL
jgi:hypothetical protein